MPDDTNQPDPQDQHGEPDPHSLPPLTTAPTTLPRDEDSSDDGADGTDGADSADGSADEGEFGAANESLAGALAVSFKVLRVVLLGLIVVFLLSGFFTVQPNEVAVRTRFGKIVPRGGEGGEVLTADGGPYFRWPAPVGQVYRIPTASQTLQIDDAFVFAAAKEPANRGKRLAEVQGSPVLDPESDGVLLTGDKGLIHARFSVTYQITPTGAADFVRNVANVAELDRNGDDPDVIFRDARQLVRAAVEAAIVAEVAGTRLDAVRGAGQDAAAAGDAGDAAGDAATQPAATVVASSRSLDMARIQAKAQRGLDGLASGIDLVTVTISEPTVPLAVRPAFDELSTAIQRRGQLAREAQSYGDTRFTDAAGKAYPAVLEVIGVFEDADRTREARPEFYAAAEAALNAVLDGLPMGQALPPLADALPPDDPRRGRLADLAGTFANDRLAGRASSSVNNAQREVTQYLADLEADAGVFEGLLADYRRAPETIRQQLFLRTIASVFAGADSTIEVLPGGQKIVRLLVNEDPAARAERETRRRDAAVGGGGGGGGGPQP